MIRLDSLDWRPPGLHPGALAVWRRNLLVWRKLVAPSLLFNFGEPFLYLLGLGFGLGRFIGEIDGIAYFTFLASGLLASAAMNGATYEGMYSVFTRMVPQKTYEAMLATPLDIEDIVAGEMLWCATKGFISASAILVVAALLGAVQSWSVLWCIPLFVLIGLAFAGPAIVASAISPSYDFFAYYQTLVLTPMFIFCGVFYPVATLPEWLQAIVQVAPLTHAIALVRPLAAGLPVNDVGVHLAVLASYAVISLYLAVVLVRRRLID